MFAILRFYYYLTLSNPENYNPFNTNIKSTVMRYLKIISAMMIIFLIPASCTSIDTCKQNGEYRIDYYSSGGFTALQTGVSIKCDGTVLFWNKMPNSGRNVTDSLTLSDSQVGMFDTLMKNPELFSYTKSYTGNYTANLVLIKDDNFNKISFNSSEIPAEFPDAVKDLIREVQNIKK